MLRLGQVRRLRWVFRTLKERTGTDPAVNLNGKSETFNKPKSHKRTHVHRCSNMTLASPPHLDHNAWGRRLQKRIDGPEGELRKEQGERVNVQAESEMAFAHAVCVGWGVGPPQKQPNRKRKSERYGHDSIRSKRGCDPDIEGTRAS